MLYNKSKIFERDNNMDKTNYNIIKKILSYVYLKNRMPENLVELTKEELNILLEELTDLGCIYKTKAVFRGTPANIYDRCEPYEKEIYAVSREQIKREFGFDGLSFLVSIDE